MPNSNDREAVDLYERNRQLLLHAREIGDKKVELILSIIAVSDDAMRMRESLQKIFTLYGDALDELASNAEQFLPVDLANRIESLQELFNEISSSVEHAASESMDIVVQLRKHMPSTRK